jgi:deoxyribodipyrimidine photolyase-related protein
MAGKPHGATGKHIARMSDYCEGCRYRPDFRTGEEATLRERSPPRRRPDS